MDFNQDHSRELPSCMAPRHVLRGFIKTNLQTTLHFPKRIYYFARTTTPSILEGYPVLGQVGLTSEFWHYWCSAVKLVSNEAPTIYSFVFRMKTDVRLAYVWPGNVIIWAFCISGTEQGCPLLSRFQKGHPWHGRTGNTQWTSETAQRLCWTLPHTEYFQHSPHQQLLWKPSIPLVLLVTGDERLSVWRAFWERLCSDAPGETERFPGLFCSNT
jgi:hypothetical protein